MSRIPIRIRLTLFFAVAMAIVLAAAGLFVYERVATDLDRAFDRDLRSRAADLSALVLRNGSLQTTGSSTTFAEVLTAEGRVLDATSTLRSQVLLTAPQLARARAGTTFVKLRAFPVSDESSRMLALPLRRDGSQLVLVVGESRESRDETLVSLKAAFLLGGPIALLLTSFGAYLLAGAALRPIEAMRRRAAGASAVDRVRPRCRQRPHGTTSAPAA